MNRYLLAIHICIYAYCKENLWSTSWDFWVAAQSHSFHLYEHISDELPGAFFKLPYNHNLINESSFHIARFVFVCYLKITLRTHTFCPSEYTFDGLAGDDFELPHNHTLNIATFHQYEHITDELPGDSFTIWTMSLWPIWTYFWCFVRLFFRIAE